MELNEFRPPNSSDDLGLLFCLFLLLCCAVNPLNEYMDNIFLAYEGHGGMLNADQMLIEGTHCATGHPHPTALRQERETVLIACSVILYSRLKKDEEKKLKKCLLCNQKRRKIKK